MKINRYFAFCFAALIVSSSCQSTRADDHATVELTPYKFKAEKLEGRIKEAMDQSKTGFSQPLDQLMEEYSTNPDKVLNLLKPYIDDPNPQVQFSLIDAAAYAPNSDQSLHILIHLLPNEDTGHAAVNTIYNIYSSSSLVKRGVLLKSALLRSAVMSRYTTHGYLLLSCYKGDAEILQFLQKRRLTFDTQKKQLDEKPSPFANDWKEQIMSLDLALMELGDNKALERITQAFIDGNPKKVLALLRYLKFVNNKTVLSLAIGQLQNKAVVQMFYSTDGEILSSIRVCDSVLPLLQTRFSPSEEVRFERPHPYSDTELNDAAQKFLALL